MPQACLERAARLEALLRQAGGVKTWGLEEDGGLKSLRPLSLGGLLIAPLTPVSLAAAKAPAKDAA